MNRNLIIGILIAIILLGGLYILSNKSYSTTPSSTSSSSSSQAMISNSASGSATPSTQGKVFTLVVKNRKLVSGPNTLSVNQGDTVTIRITCDEDEELHLHGYNKAVDLQKDKPAELTFQANIAGHFPFELEHSKTDLGAVEVQPK